MKPVKRIAAILLCMLIIVTAFPVYALAAPGTEEAEITYGDFQKSVAEQITDAKEGSLVFVDGTGWMSFDSRVADALADKDIDLVVRFTYDGHTFVTSIPADEDASELLDENGYIGFLYLSELFGANIVEDKEKEE
ncbi:MAG: hypothetical protein IJV26_00445 [Lachnospiraceae bacterium]|nr:hypothetical protein [Lachnospiraceae bacterium]